MCQANSAQPASQIDSSQATGLDRMLLSILLTINQVASVAVVAVLAFRAMLLLLISLTSLITARITTIHLAAQPSRCKVLLEKTLSGSGCVKMREAVRSEAAAQQSTRTRFHVNSKGR